MIGRSCGGYFLSAGKKARVACVLIAHSGLRLMTLGNYTGTDGLRVRDFRRYGLKMAK